MPDGAPRIGSGIDPDAVAGRIAALLAEHRPNAAKPLLAALAKLAPAHAKLPLLRADYGCEMRDPAQALAVLQDAIDEAPSNAALWLRQAEIFFGRSQFADAVQRAAQAVLLAPDSHAAKSRLGLALMRQGQFDQASPCLAESFSANPANVEVALALAALSPTTAIDILNRAIACSPRVAVLRNALTRRYLCSGQSSLALQTALLAADDGIADAQTHCLLAVEHMQESRWDKAAAAAARAQSMAPGQLWSARLLAALASRGRGRLDPFADDAPNAERGLIAGGSIASGAFRALIAEREITGPVLDLFCGPGLNAIAAQGLAAGPWSGVDPSPHLIARCAELGIYAKLQQADPLAMPLPAEVPIILLNEALAYLASPQALLAGIRASLKPDGFALAAIPTGRPGLGGHGLFMHREAAIAQYAAGAGLSFEAPRSGILRHLEGLPIHGVIAIFRPL
jgi:predicted TPR repeat methyltransferase